LSGVTSLSTPLCGIAFGRQKAKSAIPTVRLFLSRRNRCSRRLESGRRRRARAKILPQGGVALTSEACPEDDVPAFLWRSCADEEAAGQPAEIGTHDGRDLGAASLRSSRRGLDYWGWKGKYFDSEGDASAFSMNFVTCWRVRLRRPIRRNGSTPAPLAYGIDGPSQAIIMSTTRPRSSSSRRPPMSIRNRMPVSFSRSPTISSTMRDHGPLGAGSPAL